LALIKIPKKKVSSNEIQTLPEKPGSAPTKPYSTQPDLRPFIDKISIVADIPAEHGLAIHANLWPLLDEPQIFKEGPKWGKFKVGKRIPLESVLNSKKWPVFQYQYEKPFAIKVRLEFSPVDLGVQGMNELIAVLTTILPDGWGFFLEHGRVTGIEVTVDAAKIDVDHFQVLPQQSTTAQAWGMNGKLQTLVLGKSAGNQTKIYNRGAKRNANGQKGPEYEGTRIERRLKITKSLPLVKLPSLANPFAQISMVITPAGKPPGEPKEYMWEMFKDSVKVRTLPVALKLLSDEKKTLYREWFAQHPVGWWNPDIIWSKWPDYLAESGILHP
jgi:hypothetical protein